MNDRKKSRGDANTGKDENEQSPAKQQWEEMREEKKNNNSDPSLQSPQDANTQKHINFLETEEEGTVENLSSDEDEPSPAKQQWKEMREEKKNNNNIDSSLLSPQDANTQKHVNFLEAEEEGTTGS